MPCVKKPSQAKMINSSQLILNCDKEIIDEDTLKFTEPSFYTKNVLLPHKRGQQIRELMQELDLSLLPENIESETNVGSSNQQLE